MKFNFFCYLLTALFFIITSNILAGPPFRTDDPIPVPYLHGELYVFSTGVFDASDKSGVDPAMEFTYGIFPNTQFHLILPLAARHQRMRLLLLVTAIPKLE